MSDLNRPHRTILLCYYVYMVVEKKSTASLIVYVYSISLGRLQMIIQAEPEARYRPPISFSALSVSLVRHGTRVLNRGQTNK